MGQFHGTVVLVLILAYLIWVAPASDRCSDPGAGNLPLNIAARP
jgi:hypothetical protein